METEAEKKRRRGIYLLPNLFTTAGLFAGFFAIIAAMSGRFEAAAIAIFIAMFMDGIDGRLARMTNTQSDFGKEYDSLADMVSFGLAPALVMYLWALTPLGKVGFAAAFVYAAGAALRLARFNTQVGIIDKRYFQGLASPAAAALVVGLVWWGHDAAWVRGDLGWITALLTAAAGVLMVSNVRYNSFKDLDLKGKVPFFKILVVVAIFVLVALDPPRVLFAMALIYALSGPVLTLVLLRQRRAARKSADKGQ
ncbi:CDP-diacylglycerol--serine O-phosphatidyltransferase [Candidatus Tenderia electrophaga]|jgi:CDP-diacylglycerol--serine O-phosphatidyltransferase|uniref:CDP-diacylglycerol--serine O-phosphatidyltransferase n=1 Tax=Candidatus Tenderia electrophaga TaxID=1748243 RepID=A0A0S2TE92_9GAMM|nr:CDP-diacylglycerol--serine O-phosphatidyltransferase [Candidatus Tenderia electrophaga]